MTRWVRWERAWHVLDKELFYDGWFVTGLCGFGSEPQSWDVTFSDFDPVEDECRLCRRMLDGGTGA